MPPGRGRLRPPTSPAATRGAGRGPARTSSAVAGTGGGKSRGCRPRRGCAARPRRLPALASSTARRRPISSGSARASGLRSGAIGAVSTRAAVQPAANAEIDLDGDRRDVEIGPGGDARIRGVVVDDDHTCVLAAGKRGDAVVERVLAVVRATTMSTEIPGVPTSTVIALSLEGVIPATRMAAD